MYWAEYRTGIKEFTPWLSSSEGACTQGLSKPTNLDEVKALSGKVGTFAKGCENYLKVLLSAEGAANKMTTHKEADGEVAALKERYGKVKAKSGEGENQFALEKMGSTRCELKNIFKQKEK